MIKYIEKTPAKVLLEYLAKSKLNPNQFARLCGLPHGTIYYIIHGGKPFRKTALKICRHSNLKLSDFGYE